MRESQSLRKAIVVGLCTIAVGTAFQPTIALGAEADLAQKIEALQKELEALRAQVNTQAAAPAPSGISGPAGFELSIYGVGHLSADSIKTGTDSSGYVHSNSSRLGFKGSQDLGSGFAAIFQYESGVDLTGHGTGDGNGGAGSNGQIFTRARDSFVGVRGPFGTVKIGRLAAFNQWVYDYNLFGDQVGDLGNIWGGKNQPGRFDSAVQYRTPDFGGFAAALTFDPSGNQGANDSSSTIVKLDYGNGGLKVGAAYASYGQGSGNSKLKTAALTASYDFGMVNVGGGWQKESDASTGGGAPFNQDTTYYTLGAGVKLGHGMVKLQYAKADNVSATAATDGAKQWAVGYDHSWDKDTTLYAAYAKTSNDAGATFQSYNWGHGNQGVPAQLAGKDPSAFSLGVVYKFDFGLLGKR